MSQVDRIRLTVLVDDSKNPIRPELTAKHGLSFFIELKAGRHTTSLLLDTGPSADVVLQNARKLDIDLRKVDSIFLSHGHYDHTGGLLGVLKHIGKKVPVIAHPEALEPKFARRKKRLKKAGIPFQVSELQRSSGILTLKRGSTSVAPGVWVSGEIKRVSPFEEVKGFKVMRRGKLVEDYMPDDQALFVRVKGRGLVVITGCAHAGLINTIKQAQKVTGSSGVYAVVGGFHLAGASAGRINATIEELQKAGVKAVMPCHCTGKKAITKFSKVFGKKVQPA
ncbi:MAG: MBL fold metallo-hydrolase [Candidatus Hodarchaeaceae archaeon]|nr:MBL fold metallo-hydrolase [Candidatus Hodarchaeaceae archaeon]